MFAEAELSSGEESTEMEDVSETTRLVTSSGTDAAHSGSLPTSTSTARPGAAATDTMTDQGYHDGSHVNRAVELDDYRDTDDDNYYSGKPDPEKHENDSSTYTSIRPTATAPKTTSYVVLLAGFAAIGGFLFGYDTGVVSGAMLLLRDEFSLSSLQQEAVVSVTIGAAFVAALAGGVLSDRFGRRSCTMVASVAFTAGAVVLGAAQNVTMLIVGRLTLGLGIGVASMTVPVYIAEVAPPHLRGRLLTLNVLFITGGQFIASLLDGAFSYLHKDGWRYMLGLAGIPSLIQLLGFLALPESPRFLVARGRVEEARKVLVKVRGTQQVQQELQQIMDTCRQEELASGHEGTPTLVRMVRSPSMRKALVVGCGLQLFQQLSGINTVMYYSASIIKMAGVTNQHTAIWLSAMTAGVNFVFTLVGVWLVERIGRKPLLLASLAGVIVSLVVLAVGFQLNAFNSPPVTFNETSPNSSCFTHRSCESCIEDKGCGFCYSDAGDSPANGSCMAVADDDAFAKLGRCSANASAVTGPDVVWAYGYCPTPYSWMAIFGLALYLMFFAPGMGPMPWTINAEIYPLWARSTGNSMSAATNWISNLLVSMTFLTLTETLTKYGTYWLFVGVASLGFLFLLCLLPETKGRKLEEVEELFSAPWSTCCSSSGAQERQLSPTSSHVQ